ncbi:MAG TPA: hypothetical protein PK486_07975, partial [Trichococcus flocculiformis]|nr:hypothetical protein [Trichococcus flocculiformis]
FAHGSKPLFLSSIASAIFHASKNHFTKTTVVFHGLVVHLSIPKDFLNIFCDWKAPSAKRTKNRCFFWSVSRGRGIRFQIE